MQWDLCWQSGNADALLGIAVMEEVAVGPSPPWLIGRLAGPISWRVGAEDWDTAVREMLRIGGFKPTGRNRPAHEFLARASGGVPSISNLVDANNAVSLTYRLPASVIEGKVLAGALMIREGCPGERYVFNRSGQELDLEGLLVVCSASGVPVASPVKDALTAHVTEGTAQIAFCAYGSRVLLTSADMNAVLGDFVELARSVAGGRCVARWVASRDAVECNQGSDSGGLSTKSPGGPSR